MFVIMLNTPSVGIFASIARSGMLLALPIMPPPLVIMEAPVPIMVLGLDLAECINPLPAAASSPSAITLNCLDMALNSPSWTKFRHGLQNHRCDYP